MAHNSNGMCLALRFDGRRTWRAPPVRGRLHTVAGGNARRYAPTRRPTLADRPRCACAFRFQRDLQGSRCPMCCAHCNGVFEMPGDQGLHAAGCANDGAGKFEQWNAPR